MHSSRLYTCLNCHCLITICCHCDRGNRYCKQCSPIMRLRARQRANKRYQNTYQGRLNHAARQKRYRKRLKQKMTYQGSHAISLRDLISDKRKCAIVNYKPVKKQNPNDIYCHCCHKICPPFLRSDSLRRSKLARRFRM